ncbi:hypothetical protein L6452_17751 [Arctium lappa]|uniref:Uncharacterized protein n=1 Tax=Arctium lappa TaxID=4217 RepID=A0ACB9C4J6_ARCLA|nr:hypothetical protein L6452_17751 [Arctium lappa]
MPEINLRPWGSLLKDLEEGNRRTRWIDREPYAYWKGNPIVAETRMDLLKCNVFEKEDWNARVFVQFIEVDGYNYVQVAKKTPRRVIKINPETWG